MHAPLCMSETMIGFEPMTSCWPIFLKRVAVGFTDKINMNHKKNYAGALPAELHRHIFIFSASVDKPLCCFLTTDAHSIF